MLKYRENEPRLKPRSLVTGSMKNAKLAVPATIALIIKHTAVIVLLYGAPMGYSPPLADDWVKCKDGER
jgi:hypothetical protein